MNRNLKCVLSVARSEYIKWITNPRVIIVGVLLVFMRTLAIEPLLEDGNTVKHTRTVCCDRKLGNAGYAYALRIYGAYKRLS